MNGSAAKARTMELTIEREFAHPPEAVFRAWTDQEALQKWMGPGEVTVPEATMDAREGGEYVFPMITPDGSNPTVRGVIKELVPNRKLRFTWAWDQEDGSPGRVMEITLEFHPSAKGTRLVLRQTNLRDKEARDRHEHGWTGCLENLAGYLMRAP